MNEFFVGVAGDTIVTLRAIPQRLTKQQALYLAAWLATLADDTGDQFEKVLQEVQNT